MSNDHTDTELTYEQRRRLAVDLFNHTWTLLELRQRTDEQDEAMIHASHASRYHWGEIGTGANRARGEWQISFVYSTLGRAEPALFHARRCLAYVEAGDGVEDWDLPFAYEALARAFAVAGDRDESLRYEQLAREAGEGITGEEDREHFLEALATLPRRS